MANNTTAIAEKLITAEELLQHPEWEHCELIDGKVVSVSPAGAEHGRITLRLSAKILAFADTHGLGEVFAAETGFILNRNPDTVRGPDIMFLSKARVPAGGITSEFLPVVPDLAIEVISPSDTFSKVTAKAESYIAAGVRLVWVVDPETQRAYVFKKGAPVINLTKSDALSGDDVLPGFLLPLSEIFD